LNQQIANTNCNRSFDPFGVKRLPKQSESHKRNTYNPNDVKNTINISTKGINSKKFI
jgi:hypothetical protein